MEGKYPSYTLGLSLCLFVVITASMALAGKTMEGATTYIVHMEKSAMPSVFSNHKHWYTSTLSSIKTSDENSVEEMLLYAYDNVIHGFSAKLTHSEADALREIPGHIASYPDREGQLHTTRSYNFLGLNHRSGIWPKSHYGQDVIIGIIDTGVWPESRSFKDDGMTDIPARWKGQCESGTDFNSSLCNRKLVGARHFNKGYVAKYGKINTTYEFDSARDFDGHGTHTSSTAAGNFVSNVDYFGYAKGTARGMAPRARVAMYKVLWYGTVTASDVLAGMDQAIADGVDVLSLSLGFASGPTGIPYYEDPIAVGAFAAMKSGVFVACSAGNDGPGWSSVQNSAPWILTVGASTIDRDFVASVKLGNGVVISGTSYFVENEWISGIPLVYSRENESTRGCSLGSLNPTSVAGKIVLCMSTRSVDNYGQQQEANRTGAAGVIMVYEDGFDINSDEFFMPAVLLKSKDGAIVANYATTESNPTVDIQFVITLLESKPAPAVADFSSRGPNAVSPGILKPDLVAPGVDIIAAWRPTIPVIDVGYSSLQSDYNLVSGTSMSSPHAVAIASLVKAVHPEWSAAAIKSALLTTAYTLDNTKQTMKNIGWAAGRAANPFDFGAGHVNPNKATDPGLVYDVGMQDYVNFLCTLNYTGEQIHLITRTQYSCTGDDTYDLNYPSFVATFKNGTNSSSKQVKTFERIVTNVGDTASVYKAVVNAPEAVSIEVKPAVLVFKETNERLRFTVKVEIDGPFVADEFVRHGYLSWVDGKNHVVKSPVVAIFE